MPAQPNQRPDATYPSSAAGAGLGGYRMSRRVGDVSEFQFEPIGNNHQQVRASLDT